MNYLTWKKWQRHEFGQCIKAEHYYFKKLFNQHFGNTTKKNHLSALEVGFGNGHFLTWCQARGIKISGVDREEELVSRAKAIGVLAFKRLDEVPIEMRFDVICMFDLLEHLQMDQINEALLWASNRLEDGGRIAIRSPNGASPFGLNNQHGDPTHATTITTSKMESWITDKNLTVAYAGWDVYAFYNGSISKTPERLIRRGLQLFLEKLTRIIFAPQSSGILSANLLIILERKPPELSNYSS